MIRQDRLAAAALSTFTELAAPLEAKQPATSQLTPSSPRPSILAISGDDIGQADTFACSNGLVGYRTANIDRVAKRAAMFTDYWAESFRTAGPCRSGA